MNPIVVVETSKGVFEIELFPEDAPKTVKNFIELTKRGYYDSVLVHRVAKGFIIQAGDPTGTGAGGTSIYGKTFEDELNPDTPSYQRGYVRGTVAMANSGPNTNTSQFFIMLRDNALPHNYTIFGRVIAGMDVIDAIASVEIEPVFAPTDGRPKEDIYMTRVYLKSSSNQ
ncbi:MAG: peptidylprolyl isomerase [Chlorobi bacterium]|nr:peptidylprolyl isomerase [Chlorobiota bacterium]